MQESDSGADAAQNLRRPSTVRVPKYGQIRWLTGESAHWAWPQLQIISAVFASPSQYVLQ